MVIQGDIDLSEVTVALEANPDENIHKVSVDGDLIVFVSTARGALVYSEQSNETYKNGVGEMVEKFNDLAAGGDLKSEHGDAKHLGLYPYN